MLRNNANDAHRCSYFELGLPVVIAGTRICKLLTRSLVVHEHRVEANPNSRVRRSIVSEEAHARRSPVWSSSYENVHVRCSGSEFSWQIFFSTIRGLTKFKTRRSLSDGTMVNFGIGLTRRWAFSLRCHKITGDIQTPACWKVIWKWENYIMSCYS